jgi:CubicO group peptidase (beta-lactamase class C family)
MRKLNLKMRWIYFFSLTVLAISCLSILNCNPKGKNSSDNNNEQNGTPVNIDPVHRTLLDFMTQQLQANGVPGGAIAIVSNGTLSNASGVGVKNHSNDSQVRPDTLFINCSITKMLTAGGVMTLVDEGTVDTDAPVTNYVPYFSLRSPFNPSDITVHHCLTHTSGIPDYIEVRCDTDSDALSRWFRLNSGFPLWSPPDRLWNYSNLGYSLAGLVVEEMSGLPFAEAMKQRIFTPAGMTEATYFPNEVISSGNYAIGHSYEDGELRHTIFPDTYHCPLGYPPGLLWASAMDMAHYCEILLAGGGEVLTVESVNKMKDKLVDTRQYPGMYYAYGLMTIDVNDFTMVYHDGGITGFRTTFYMIPEHNFGVVVMLNADHYNPGTIAVRAITTYLDLPEITLQPVTTDPDTWGIYTGKYNDPYELGEFDIYQDSEKRLWGNFNDLDITKELFQIANDCFYFDISSTESTEYNLIATFFLDDDGNAEYFATRAGVGKRVQESKVSLTLDKHLPEVSPEARRKRIEQKARRTIETLPYSLFSNQKGTGKNQ